MLYGKWFVQEVEYLGDSVHFVQYLLPIAVFQSSGAPMRKPVRVPAYTLKSKVRPVSVGPTQQIAKQELGDRIRQRCHIFSGWVWPRNIVVANRRPAVGTEQRDAVAFVPEFPQTNLFRASLLQMSTMLLLSRPHFLLKLFSFMRRYLRHMWWPTRFAVLIVCNFSTTISSHAGMMPSCMFLCHAISPFIPRLVFLLIRGKVYNMYTGIWTFNHSIIC